VERWRDRMINVHPSLLPSFKGLDTHARALEIVPLEILQLNALPD